VDVIGHDAPGNEAISLSIEVSQSTLNEARNPFIAKIAGAPAIISVFFNPFAQFDGFL
jgi:hypothetical protein